MVDAAQNPILSMRGIRKAFGGIAVLNGVDFDVRPGEVHALVGENGAGKSTLLKIAAGVVPLDEGRMLFAGCDMAPRGPSDAIRAGIGMVHQELSLAPDVSVAENIFVGNLPTSRFMVDWRELNNRTATLLSEFDLPIDPFCPVSGVGIGYRQVIEILKVLALEPRVMIFDEPTSSLEAHEVEIVLDTIKKLRARSIGVVYISHRLDEVFELSDRITVLRDGTLVGTWSRGSIDRARVVNAMVGRDMSDLYPDRAPGVGDELLRVEGLSRFGVFRDVSFSLRKGELLGFSGLVGSGRTEVMRAVFGIDRPDSGSIYMEGRRVCISSPKDAIRNRIAYIPEDRKALGLFLERSIQDNIVCASLDDCSANGFVDSRLTRSLSEDYSRKLSVKAHSLDQEAGRLSGGNQQKVLLARWLAARPKVLIADEPTRGVDVGAKAEIHRILRDYANQGNGVIVVSSEMPEILGLCDRIIVMREGCIVDEVQADGATEQVLISRAVG